MLGPATPERAGRGLHSMLLDQLTQRLLDGRYPVGARISIEDVKAEFGVSKQPVMDAMRRLEAVGLVQIVPQSGCRVAHYSQQEVEDFFRLFGRFEGEVAAAAAGRRSDDQLIELDDAWQRVADVEELDNQVERSRRYRRRNRDFHVVIHRMSHSPLMADLSRRMWDLSDFLVTTVGGIEQLSNAIHDRNHDHDTIRTAIRLRNPEVARAAMESHITGITSTFSEQLGADH